MQTGPWCLGGGASEHAICFTRGAGMTGVETLAWLVLAFVDGSDCLLQGSFHRLPESREFVREDGCPVRSHQGGGYVVFWSDNRWVAIKIPKGARSLSYRWGRAMAFVNGDSVKVQHGKIMSELQSGPAVNEHENVIPFPKRRAGNIPIPRSVRKTTLV